MSNHDWSHFDRFVEIEDASFYEKVDLKPEEYNRVHDAWCELAKGMSREAILTTMEENRSIASPIFEACYKQLSVMEQVVGLRILKAEEVEAWSLMSLKGIRRLGKKRKKSGKFIAKVIKYRDENLEELKMAA